jgi:hypothetical protein
MSSPDRDPNDATVDHARVALRRLGEAPPSREAAGAALEELEAAWRKRPFTIGVAGDDAAARTALLNALCGGLLERDGRGPGSAPVRVRRGAATRFRAKRRDGTAEEATLPGAPAAPGAPGGERRPDDDVVRARIGARETELLRAERAVPRLARETPPWWAFWLWLIRWIVVRRARPKLESWQRARAQLAEAQRELGVAEAAPPAPKAEAPDARERFFARLRMLCSATIASRDVQEIALEVAGGPLADDVEVIELTGAAAQAGVDVTVRAAGAQVELASGESSMRKALGSPGEAALGLSRLPAEARALGIARRAREVLGAQITRLDEEVMRVEIELRNRIARLENLRMPDAQSFVAAQVARISAQASASITAVLEHAGVHLGSELAERAAQWDAQINAASTPDELKARAARIDEESVAEHKRIAQETRMLVMGGVGGSAHDLLVELFAALRQPGLPDEHAVPPRRAPALPPVAMLPSLVEPKPSTFAGELSGAGQWVAGLFRSIDKRRAELRDKVRQRAERVRGLAEAELRDAEPALRAALLEVCGRELTAGVERRVTWLEAELAKERLAVDAERAALRPITEVLEDARREVRGLQERIGVLETPSVVVAASGVA